MDIVNEKKLVGTPAPNENGKWVPVDPNSVGFNVDNAPNGAQFQGVDGSVYCVGQTAPQYSSVASNANNAIPVPSSIVQMPPIVQPIALVPYTSQNQPMLQYDPYSRPVDPNVAPKAPNYVKKPYRGISLACFLIALACGILTVLLSIARFRENDARVAGSANGADLIAAFLKLIGVKSVNSYYYNYKMAPFITNGQWGASDMLSTIVTLGIPVCIIIVIVLCLVLFIKYIVKFAQRKTPRCFSVVAFLNIILTLAVAGLIIGMSDGEVKIANGDRIANVKAFFTQGSTIFWGIGWLIAFLSSLALFILPLCCKKNAYMVEKSADDKTYILNK